MPFGSKKAKTAASANKQQRVGLPDILLDAVVRHYGLLEAAAAGSDAGGGEGAPSGRVNQHDAHASAERERALLAATDDCIAYLAANPEFVARVTGRLRVNEQLQGRIDSLLQAVDEQKVAVERQGTGEGHCNLRVPNYALMLSVMTIINLQRKIDELQRTAAVGVVAAAVVSPAQPGGTLPVTTPLNAVGVTPATLERREVGVQNYIEKLGVPEFADILPG